MKANKPVGFAALLEKMPRRFVARFKRVEERAKRRRDAQAQRFEQDFQRNAEIKRARPSEWPDTIADFNARAGDDPGAG